MLQEVSHLLMHKAFSYSWQAAMPSASPLLINLTLSLISYICYPLYKKEFRTAKLFFIASAGIINRSYPTCASCSWHL